MNTATTDRAVPESLVRVLSGRVYGQQLEWDTRAVQPLPAFCEPIGEEMVRASVLIALPSGSGRESIYRAYEEDLKFLQKRLSDIVACVKSAVRHSAIRQSHNELSEEKEWEKLKKNIPSFGHISMLELSADLAAQESEMLLASLQVAYRSGVKLLLERMCLWFDTLVGFEFVGQVEFTSRETGRYYYYRHSLTQRTKMNETRVDIKETDDPEVPFGQRVTYTTAEQRHWIEVHDLELHEHHIVRAREQPIADFAQPLPPRVKAFIESLPSWLRHHMTVVSGTITLERIIKRKLQEKEGLDVKILNVTKGSPAVALGNYTFVGWSDDDLREGRVMSHIQKNYSEVRNKGWWRFSMRALLALATVGILIGFALHTIAKSDAESAATYQKFVEEVRGQEQHTVKKNDYTVLEGEYPIAYMGRQQHDGGYRAALTTSVRKGWEPGSYGYYQLTVGPDRVYYGFADLAPDLRIPLVIRVVSATDESITFVVERKENPAAR